MDQECSATEGEDEAGKKAVKAGSHVTYNALFQQLQQLSLWDAFAFCVHMHFHGFIALKTSR